VFLVNSRSDPCHVHKKRSHFLCLLLANLRSHFAEFLCVTSAINHHALASTHQCWIDTIDAVILSRRGVTTFRWTIRELRTLFRSPTSRRAIIGANPSPVVFSNPTSHVFHTRIELSARQFTAPIRRTFQHIP